MECEEQTKMDFADGVDEGSEDINVEVGGTFSVTCACCRDECFVNFESPIKYFLKDSIEGMTAVTHHPAPLFWLLFAEAEGVSRLTSGMACAVA